MDCVKFRTSKGRFVIFNSDLPISDRFRYFDQQKRYISLGEIHALSESQWASIVDSCIMDKEKKFYFDYLNKYDYKHKIFGYSFESACISGETLIKMLSLNFKIDFDKWNEPIIYRRIAIEKTFAITDSLVKNHPRKYIRFIQNLESLYGKYEKLERKGNDLRITF